MAGVGVLGVVVLVGWIQLTSGTGTNVAQNKPAWMSSVHYLSPPASAAVDGVTLAYEFKYAVVTNTLQQSAWWKVDLQTQVQSARVTLYFRTDYKSRRNGVQLYTSMTNSSDPKEGNLCHSVTGRPNGTDIPDVLNVTCPGTWRYLTVYTETDNDGYGALLDFVELQVWICASGYYGSNCEQSCAARHCKSDSSCDVIGLCVGGCAAGYQGTDCTQECHGTYGINCNKTCGHCANNNNCHHVDGICPDGCQAGWKLDLCQKGCGNGKFGLKCERDCGHCNGTCDAVDGRCFWGCTEGYNGSHCSVKLLVCPSGYYGSNCDQSCAARHCKSDSSCGVIGGLCDGGCAAGYQGTDCTQVSPVTIGVIGGAVGIAVMLLLIGGLMICLLKAGRLKWIPTTTTGPQELRRTDTRNTGVMSTHAPTSDVNDQDYTTLNKFTREDKSLYDVIQNENNQI